QRLIGRRHILRITVIMDKAALAIIDLVREAHFRIVRLISVTSPAVEKSFAIAVEVDEISDGREAVEKPHDVASFGLRCLVRTDIGFVIARLRAVLHRPWREKPLKLPQDREVAVQIHAHAFRSATAWRGPTVLSPPWMIRHAEMTPIR